MITHQCELCDKPVPVNLPAIWGELAEDQYGAFAIGHLICNDCAEHLPTE
jgi:hypothetical protein